MPKLNQPRSGSLQYWPRKRAAKLLPSANWNAINSEISGLMGFIGYKVGMKTAIVKDNTNNSLTKSKRIAIPVTIVECPTMKVLSVRFYKNGIVMKEILAENLDKELKRKIRMPKKKHSWIEMKDYEDVRLIVYSQVKKTGIKKTPDISEVGLAGNLEGKLKFAQEHLGKEISVTQVFKKGALVDIHGVTKGKGLQGPVKRFGISLKNHKSEKGVRRPGSLGPWHPARVTYYAPQAGQLGVFTRPTYNHKLIDIGNDPQGFLHVKNYGNVKNEYLIIMGSVPGPEKRQILLTAPLRATKKQLKKNFDLVEVR